jgi:hypothetical protein
MASADMSCSRLEAAAARSLAACVHPVAAWRLQSRTMRLRIVVGYMAAGYALGLIALMA